MTDDRYVDLARVSRRIVTVIREDFGQRLPEPVKRLAKPAVRRMEKWLPAIALVLDSDGGLPRTQASYFGVAAGQMLNLRTALPAGWLGCSADDVRLLLLGRQSAFTVPVRLVRSRGTVAVDVSVRLGEANDGLAVTRGTWRLRLVRTHPDGTEEQYVVAAKPVAWADGNTGPTTPCLATGWSHEPAAAVSGAAVLLVRPPGARAEVTAVRATASGLAVHGTLSGVAASQVTARIVRRKNIDEWPARISADADGRFRIDLPVERMLPDGGDLERIWDVYLYAEDKRLRLGRYCHDVRQPRAVFRLPRRTVDTAAGLLGLRPYYTPAGSFAVVCERLDTTGNQ